PETRQRTGPDHSSPSPRRPQAGKRPVISALTPSDARMTPLRENRSTAAPANRDTRILGIKKAINTRAVAWAESVSVTINQTRATRKMWSPTWERVCPVHKSEKFRLFQTRARRDIHNKKLFFV